MISTFDQIRGAYSTGNPHITYAFRIANTISTLDQIRGTYCTVSHPHGYLIPTLERRSKVKNL